MRDPDYMAPGRRRGELIGQEVVLCGERQMPRLYRLLYGRKRTGKLRGHHNHVGSRSVAVRVANTVSAVPLALIAFLGAMFSHDPNTAKRQWLRRTAPAALLLGVLLPGAGGCTYVKKGDLTYCNLGFEKQISKVKVNADGSAELEGVKNTTPQIVESAVSAGVTAAVKAAK